VLVDGRHQNPETTPLLSTCWRKKNILTIINETNLSDRWH